MSGIQIRAQFVSRSCACMLSLFHCVQLFATLWTVALQAPLSTGFYRQEYWSGLPYPPSGCLPETGTEPASLMPPALAAGSLTLIPPGKPTDPKAQCSGSQVLVQMYKAVGLDRMFYLIQERHDVNLLAKHISSC